MGWSVIEELDEDADIGCCVCVCVCGKASYHRHKCV